MAHDEGLPGEGVRLERGEEERHLGHIGERGELAVDRLLEHDVAHDRLFRDPERARLLGNLPLDERSAHETRADDVRPHAGPGWHSYFSLIAAVNNSPEWGRRLMGGTFDSTVRQFIRAVMDSLPDAAPEDIFWGYNFLTGALTLSLAETGRLDALSDRLCRSRDVAALKARLGPYVVAGLRGLAQRRSR